MLLLWNLLLLSFGLCCWPSLFWLLSWPSIVPRSVFLSGSLATFFVLLSVRLACFCHNAVSDFLPFGCTFYSACWHDDCYRYLGSHSIHLFGWIVL
jgi:hypothetical protein